MSAEKYLLSVTFTRTKSFTVDFYVGGMKTVVIVQTAQRTVSTVVGTAEERWLHDRTRIAPAVNLNLIRYLIKL